ncbi:hypothetical protein CCMA1212_004530 [Trichoderma ghanense]|uniref:Uncharacterized protein n=1 Tax=Trichoderma ghanense TaxID=65468 RepID=A0ABY2H9C4_9HYPO
MARSGKPHAPVAKSPNAGLISKGASDAIIHAPSSRGRTQTRRPTLSTLLVQPAGAATDQIHDQCLFLVTASETICRNTVLGSNIGAPNQFPSLQSPGCALRRTTHSCVPAETS